MALVYSASLLVGVATPGHSRSCTYAYTCCASYCALIVGYGCVGLTLSAKIPEDFDLQHALRSIYKMRCERSTLLCYRNAASKAVRASVFSSRYFTITGVLMERP